MYDSEDLAAAVRQAAVNLTAAAAAVGRVLESVADAIAPQPARPAPSRRAAPRKKTASSKPTRSRSAPGKRAGRTTRGRSSPA